MLLGVASLILTAAEPRLERLCLPAQNTMRPWLSHVADCACCLARTEGVSECFLQVRVCAFCVFFVLVEGPDGLLHDCALGHCKGPPPHVITQSLYTTQVHFYSSAHSSQAPLSTHLRTAHRTASAPLIMSAPRGLQDTPALTLKCTQYDLHIFSTHLRTTHRTASAPLITKTSATH